MRRSGAFIVIGMLAVAAFALTGCESGWSRAARMREAARDWEVWSAFYLFVAACGGVWGLIALVTIPFAGKSLSREAVKLRSERATMDADLAAAAADRQQRAAELEAAKVGMPYLERLAVDLEADARNNPL